MANEALALIEFSSIGRGSRVVDDIAKKAPIHIHTAEPVSSGKFLLIFYGDIGAVEESFREGVAAGGASVINKVFLPQVHPFVLVCIDARAAADVDALGIVEMSSLSTTLAAADAAAKAAEVKILEIRLGKGIGGKGFFTITGSQGDVEAALAAAVAVAETDKFLIDVELIPRPSPEMIATVTGTSPYARRKI